MHITNAEETIQHYIMTYQMANFLNEDLLNCLQLFHFPAYSHIFMEEDEQHYLYFLVKGQAQCYHFHGNGKLAVIALSTPFTAIGDLEVLSDARVNSNVIAIRDTVMLGLSNTCIERYGADDPRFLRFLIEQLREKLYHKDTMQMSKVLPVINRLAAYMLSEPIHDENAIILPDKESLASLLGATTRHLNRVLKELVDSGHISAGYPRVRILDRAALEGLTG